MAQTHDFTETSISQELTYNLMEHYNLIWATNRCPGLYRTIFFTMANVLRFKKSKSTPKIGSALKDTNGTFKIGAILTYHAPEDNTDDDDKGNYTLEFTIHESDMNDLDVILDNHSDLFIEASGKMAFDIMSCRFVSMEYCNNIFVEAIDTLIKFMDANATEDGEFTVVYNGVFTATVTVEGGEKIISIVPGEMIKQYIKGDNSL